MASVTQTKQKGGKVRTTTYETRHSYDTDGPVRSHMTPRSTVIHRTSQSPFNSTFKPIIQSAITYGHNPFPSGSYGPLAHTGVHDVVDSANKEKSDMQGLNQRLGNYIEKVRFLEAQNRKQADELEKLKQKWGKETAAVKAMYQAELDEARKLLDDTEKEKARFQVQCDSMGDQINDLQERSVFNLSRSFNLRHFILLRIIQSQHISPLKFDTKIFF